MQRLKQELEKVGARLNEHDLSDPDNFSGIRRLRILHKKALETHDQTSPTFAPVDLAIAQGNTTRAPVRRPRSKSEAIHMVEEAGGFIPGLSTGASIGVVVGGSVLLAIVGFVVFKYMQWRPKQIARKGYKAVAKSKGIQQDEGSAVSPDGVIRAGTKPI